LNLSNGKVHGKSSHCYLTVRELLDHLDQTWEYIINDPDGEPYLVLLPLAHFHALRDKPDKRKWWEMREVIDREIQLAMDLPDNPTIRDMIEFGQR
jgi:hypothetical protein